MKFTVLLMGLGIILGSIFMILNLPPYASDEIRLVLIFVPIVTSLGIILKG